MAGAWPHSASCGKLAAAGPNIENRRCRGCAGSSAREHCPGGAALLASAPSRTTHRSAMGGNMAGPDKDRWMATVFPELAPQIAAINGGGTAAPPTAPPAPPNPSGNGGGGNGATATAQAAPQAPPPSPATAQTAPPGAARPAAGHHADSTGAHPSRRRRLLAGSGGVGTRPAALHRGHGGGQSHEKDR